MKLLVPIDFTPVTENALHYALQLPSVKEVVLFHVVNSDGETDAACKKLDELISKYKAAFPVEMSSSVVTGNIFDHIGEEAINRKCDIITMGTHGIKGMQRILGSRAMKVITNSKTPYIVVQNKPFREIKNIIVPVDFTKENKQILSFLVTLSEILKSNIQLLLQSAGKDEFIKNKIDNNVSYFRSVLESNSCKYTILDSGYSYDKRYKDIMKQAVANSSDMIVAAIDPKVGAADYIMGVEEQKIVANEEQLPVLCINTKSFSKFSGSIFEGSA